jgi:hypothetical protein
MQVLAPRTAVTPVDGDRPTPVERLSGHRPVEPFGPGESMKRQECTMSDKTPREEAIQKEEEKKEEWKRRREEEEARRLDD